MFTARSGNFYSAAATDDYIVFTGGVGTPNAVTVYELSTASTTLSAEGTLNEARLGHCSATFDHPTYGTVVAVAGGFEINPITVEYIIPETAEVILDETATNQPSGFYVLFMSCITNEFNDGFYMIGGSNDGSNPG